MEKDNIHHINICTIESVVFTFNESLCNIDESLHVCMLQNRSHIDIKNKVHNFSGFP